MKYSSQITIQTPDTDRISVGKIRVAGRDQAGKYPGAGS